MLVNEHLPGWVLEHRNRRAGPVLFRERQRRSQVDHLEPLTFLSLATTPEAILSKSTASLPEKESIVPDLRLREISPGHSRRKLFQLIQDTGVPV